MENVIRNDLEELIDIAEHYLSVSKFYGGSRVRLENKINEIKQKLNGSDSNI